jgi:hypothetical protein
VIIYLQTQEAHTDHRFEVAFSRCSTHGSL